MSTLAVIVVIAIVFVIVLKLINQGKSAIRNANSPPRGLAGPSRAPETASERAPAPNMDWLRDRWAAAEREQASGELKHFPAWYFDPPSQHQLERLKADDLPPPPGLTKGQASDLIGLREPTYPDDEEILRFFKVPLRGMNQSKARHEVSRLLADAANVQAWEARPPDTMQREFFRFFGLKLAKDTTQRQATVQIAEYREKLGETDAGKLDEWESFTEIVAELDDPETRESYDLKKVPLPTLRAALEALQTEGHTIFEVASDIDLLVEKVLEMKPELQRA